MVAAKDLIVGKVYQVKSRRKGNFKMRIDSVSGEWIEGTITDGVAGAMSASNVREEGETVTVRESLADFEELQT